MKNILLTNILSTLDNFDFITLAILLIVIVGLMLGIYALFVIHRTKNVYSKQLSEGLTSLNVESIVEEDDEPVQEEVQDETIDETPVQEEVEEVAVVQEEVVSVAPVQEEPVQEVIEEEPVQEEHHHDFQFYPAVEPTCCEEGNVQYYLCINCGKKYIDEAATMEIENIVVPATGHQFTKYEAVRPTCNKAGSVEYYECDKCFKKYANPEDQEELHKILIPLTTHDLVKHEEVLPTETEDGCKEYYECSYCNMLFSDPEGKDHVKKSSLVIEALGKQVIKEKLSQSTLASHEMTDLIKESVTVEEAKNAIDDNKLKDLVEYGRVHPKHKGAKKEKFIINVDDVCDKFENGDTVDLDSLKEKNLLPKKCNYFKVLARGILNKSLTFIANDFSNDAIKMILVTGGKVIQLEEE